MAWYLIKHRERFTFTLQLCDLSLHVVSYGIIPTSSKIGTITMFVILYIKKRILYRIFRYVMTYNHTKFYMPSCGGS